MHIPLTYVRNCLQAPNPYSGPFASRARVSHGHSSSIYCITEGNFVRIADYPHASALTPVRLREAAHALIYILAQI